PPLALLDTPTPTPQLYTLSLHDALPILRKDFAEKHPEYVRAFAKVTLDAYADYRQDPQAWLASADNLAKVSRLSGAKVEDIPVLDRKSTRLNSSHVKISYAVFCLKKKTA